MNVIERRLLRGPNLHALAPVLPSGARPRGPRRRAVAALPGFTDRLVGLVPGLIEHRCSVGRRGGFVERLHDGTYMAHIVEHLMLALQNLAGHDVGFGKARMVHGAPRHYRVVVAYLSERVVDRALDIAMDLVLAAGRGLPYELEPALAELRAIAAAPGARPEHARDRRSGAAARASRRCA